MSSAKQQQRPRTKRRVRQRKKRRGPLMRFKLSHVILIWIFCLIVAFVMYMFSRNLHPERDVFLTKNRGDESSAAAPVIETNSAADNSTAEVSGNDNSTAEGENSADEPTVTVPTKINPVPEGEMQPASYLETCAFVGETDIYNMGQAGLIGVMNTYAGETLRLTNYGSENILLNGTTIHIQSALYAASCPIYLMFGTEDLLEQPADQTADQFSVLMNTIKASAPESEIFVLAIPPVTAAGEKVIENSTIDEYNSLLLQAANEANVYYIDTNTALKNNESRLSDSYALEDGIHLTPEACQILLNYVLCHVPQA